MRIIAETRRSVAWLTLIGSQKVFVVVSNVEFAIEVLCIGCVKAIFRHFNCNKAPLLLGCLVPVVFGSSVVAFFNFVSSVK